ncbi:MAG TPA: hypothetical protein ENJ04_08790 [Nitrospirae bacterium]|nr:hypothetical protein [Nitrospirota bacterium]
MAESVPGFSARISAAFCAVVLLLLLAGCNQRGAETERPFEEGVRPEIVSLTPKKPVKIVLKRTSKGLYSWELRGDDVEGIIDADRRLRRYLSGEDGDEKGRTGEGGLQK